MKKTLPDPDLKISLSDVKILLVNMVIILMETSSMNEKTSITRFTTVSFDLPLLSNILADHKLSWWDEETYAGFDVSVNT